MKKNCCQGRNGRGKLRALQTSDFILIFLSRISVAKRGYVQREMKLALDAWQELPEGVIHTIPVRLDDCDVPESFQRYHWANLFDLADLTALSAPSVPRSPNSLRRKSPPWSPC